MKKLFQSAAFVVISSAVAPSYVFAQSADTGSMLGGLTPLLLIFVFFYLFIIRPQQKRTKEHQNLLNSLKKDDRIITAGGLYGNVVAVKGNIVEVKISDGVTVQVAKQTISAVVTKQDEEAARTPEIVKK